MKRRFVFSPHFCCFLQSVSQFKYTSRAGMFQSSVNVCVCMHWILVKSDNDYIVSWSSCDWIKADTDILCVCVHLPWRLCGATGTAGWLHLTYHDIMVSTRLFPSVLPLSPHSSLLTLNFLFVCSEPFCICTFEIFYISFFCPHFPSLLFSL